jgi:hypothetical protein
MTPQAFSYPTVGPNGMIYVPPYGLKERLDFMLVVNPKTYDVKKIKLDVDKSTEKWQKGIIYRNLIYFLPYNEKSILVVDTTDDSVSYIDVPNIGTGKYIQGHIYNNKIYALPYGEHAPYKFVLILDLKTNTIKQIEINLINDDEKKWHQTQIIHNIIYGLPRGENLDVHFNYSIEFDCDKETYKIENLVENWSEYDKEKYCNKKFTTVAKVGNKLWAPPYSEYKGFDIFAKYDNGWTFEKTGLSNTSRKFYSHIVASNKKIYCPPAGHDEDWAEMMIIDTNTDIWYTKNLDIGKESKKYFAGAENSQGKIYYIPRGGCVCEPEETWKQFGDLAEILVVDTKDDSYYTIDVSEYFIDNTTIEKYNQCVILDDIIFAFPYGESDSFQTVLVFDTIKEKVIKTIDLNDI